MASEIGRISVEEDRFMSNWGVKVYDYSYMKMHVDLQDLLVAITQNRAVSIEDEVMPLQEIISRRNKRLSESGAVLQKLTELQALFTGEKTSGESVGINDVLNPPEFTAKEFWEIMADIGYPNDSYPSQVSLSKSEVEGAVARCKNVIDEMNNDSQRDMTRLQAVVDRRDESFSAATQLMTSVSDTRSALIKNL